ncbi:MAG: hypothetical protein IPH44_38605 [Myxococcales bacterium]|nr:hypothetical protein [Myxococcales bacterium]MBK7197638.1 hypothetical protein [Myxococcales bacterium]MBP6844508.1 hypothetical protein [Kofleriaceae bacterium]
MSGAAALLAAWRDELNARFARDAGDLAPDAMLGFLRRTAVPILDGWDGEPAPAVLIALFELGIVGLRTGLCGAAEPSRFEQALVARAPALAPLIARAPGLVLRALGNGYLNVARARGPEVAAAWLEALAAGAARCDAPGALLDLGIVLGWRAGLAEARDAALDRVGRFEPALIAALFGAATIDPDPARRFCRPGATGPLGPLVHVATVGGFVGFGGPFRRPPRAAVVAERLVCTDGEATLELHADVFGARLVPAAWAHAAAQAAPDHGACAGVVVETAADSHQVRVLGRREAGA